MTQNEKYLAIFACVAVGIINIALNHWARTATNKSAGISELVASREFYIALAIGLCSFAGLLFVYSMKLKLYQGIILMGAISILGGTIFGLYQAKKMPAWPEIGLMICIVFFFVMNWVKAPSAN